MQSWQDRANEFADRKAAADGLDLYSFESVCYNTLALAGEVGEFANLIKKWWRGDQMTDEMVSKIEDEFADMVICLQVLETVLMIDTSRVVHSKIDQLYQRWPHLLDQD